MKKIKKKMINKTIKINNNGKNNNNHNSAVTAI